MQPTAPDVTSASVVQLERVLRGLRTQKQRFSTSEVASLGLMLLDALDGAPDEHLEQPDPRSLLLSRAGTIRVLRPARARGVFKGHLRWLTPEAVAGRALTERSDVFSVCSVLFAAATTLAPFPGDSDLTVLLAIREGRLVGTLESLRPDLPSSFAQLVHRGLEVEPLRRLESRMALRSALVPFTGGVEAARESFVRRAFTLAPPSAPSTPAALDDAAMVEAITKGDESARLVYADLLEERGLSHQARWLRSESRVQTMPAGAERDAVIRELKDLRQLVGREFLATVGRPALEGCPVRFGFRCPMKWQELTPTADPVVRHCAGCDSPVTFFDSLELAQRASLQGQCVAVDLSVERHEGDLDPAQHATVGMIG